MDHTSWWTSVISCCTWHLLGLIYISVEKTRFLPSVWVVFWVALNSNVRHPCMNLWTREQDWNPPARVCQCAMLFGLGHICVENHHHIFMWSLPPTLGYGKPSNNSFLEAILLHHPKSWRTEAAQTLWIQPYLLGVVGSIGRSHSFGYGSGSQTIVETKPTADLFELLIPQL